MTQEISLQNYTLTIIVPVANMFDRLHNLQSWINTSQSNEVLIVLVHDRIDERTGVQLLEISENLQHSKTLLIEGKFGSPGKARNEGLKYVKSDWVCFWDSDDLPNLEKTLNFLTSNKIYSDLIICNFSVNKLGNLTHFYHENNLDLVALTPGIWRMIFRTSCIANKKFPNIRMGEDLVFLAKLGLTRKKILFLQLNNYVYFSGSEMQLTRNANLNSLTALTLLRNSPAESTIDRFYSIIFMRLFGTSIAQLKFKYPLKELIRNVRFLASCNFKAIIYTILMSFLHRKKIR